MVPIMNPTIYAYHQFSMLSVSTFRWCYKGVVLILHDTTRVGYDLLSFVSIIMLSSLQYLSDVTLEIM